MKSLYLQRNNPERSRSNKNFGEKDILGALSFTDTRATFAPFHKSSSQGTLDGRLTPFAIHVYCLGALWSAAREATLMFD